MVCTATVPFTNNPSPKEDGPEHLQRVAVDFRAVPGMEIRFDVEERSLVRVYGHIGFQLAGANPGQCLSRSERARDTLPERMMITLGLQLNKRWISSGSKIGSNPSRDDHYHVVSFAWSEVVDPGRYSVRLMARAVDVDRGKCRAYFKPGQFSRMQVEVIER